MSLFRADDGTAAGQPNSLPQLSGAASPSSEQVSQEHPGLQLGRQLPPYGTQTQAEVEELEKMITEATITPRKAKRVCNV